MITEIDDVLRCLSVEEMSLKKQRVLMKRLARRRLGLPMLPVPLHLTMR